MRVTFRAGHLKQSDGTTEEVDFVDITTGRDGKDVVSRPATSEDKAKWAAEYAAYVGPPAEVPKDEAPAVVAPKTKKGK